MERGRGFSAPLAGMKGRRRNEAVNVWMMEGREERRGGERRRKREEPMRGENKKCNWKEIRLRGIASADVGGGGEEEEDVVERFYWSHCVFVCATPLNS